MCVWGGTEINRRKEKREVGREEGIERRGKTSMGMR